MKFNAVDFIKQECFGQKIINFEVCDCIADIVNFWEQERGADGCEDIYDMRKVYDRQNFIKRYGEDAIEKYVKINNHYGEKVYMIGGANFPIPRGIHYSELMAIIKNEFDLEYFEKLLSEPYNYGGQMEQILSKWFDIEKIKKCIEEKYSKKMIFAVIKTSNYQGNQGVEVVEVDFNYFLDDNIMGWELNEQYHYKGGSPKAIYIKDMVVGDIIEVDFPNGAYLMRIG